MLPKLFKRKLTSADYVVIIANLMPVYGVWFLNWPAKDAFIVYALETLIVGLFTIIKMAIRTIYIKQDNWQNNHVVTKVSGLFFILFFIAHYGLFAAIQTSIFSATANLGSSSNPLYFMLHCYEYINRNTTIILSVFVTSYIITDLFPFMLRKEYKTVPLMTLMFLPYGRIVIQQLIVIAGSMFLVLGFDKGFILVFAMVKIFFEVYIGIDRFMRKAMIDATKESAKQ